jgi:DNA-binding NarL/FixJ family response regulator
MLQVLVVDDTRLYRDGLVEFLERQPSIACVASAADRAAALLLLLHGYKFEVILVNMTIMGGVAVCADLVRAAPDSRVVALAASGAEDEAVAWAEAGVSGYLLRDQSLTELMDTIATVARGETSCPQRIAAMLMRRVGTVAAERSLWHAQARLTRREEEILSLIEQGLSNKEIARRLCIEVRTVKNHVHNLLEKLKVHRRGEAAAMVREYRLGAKGQ